MSPTFRHVSVSIRGSTAGREPGDRRLKRAEYDQGARERRRVAREWEPARGRVFFWVPRERDQRLRWLNCAMRSWASGAIPGLFSRS